MKRPAAGTTGGWPHFTPRCRAGRGSRPRHAATLAEIVSGPAHENDGRMNLFGALRTSMATCGYETVKEFQKAEIMVAPALLQTEGKSLQREQQCRDGSLTRTSQASGSNPEGRVNPVRRAKPRGVPA